MKYVGLITRQDTNADDLDAMLAAVAQDIEIHPGMPVTAVILKALLTPDDIADIEAARIPIESLRAYAESFAEGIASGRIKHLPSADDRRHSEPAGTTRPIETLSRILSGLRRQNVAEMHRVPAAAGGQRSGSNHDESA